MKKVIVITSILMVFFWVAPALALDVTLQWDANTEDDLAGYKVYYKNLSDTPGPIYDGTGALEGDSPIDVGNVTTITLHGLPDGVTVDLRNRFAVTAYNIMGLESGYSNEVSVGVPKDPGNLVIKKSSP